MKKEVWKICEIASDYEISNHGNIRRIGKITNRKQQTHYKGYKIISIMTNSGTRKTLKIHRLVALAFVDNLDPDSFTMVNHLDCVKDNNYYENLEWCDNSTNQKHAFKNELQSNTGDKNPRSKLTEADVICIRKNIDNLTRLELSKKYNVGKSCIDSVINRKTWKHI